MVGLGHVVAAGADPLEHEDGAGRRLDRHHHHQHPRGDVEWLEEGGGGDDPSPLHHHHHHHYHHNHHYLRDEDRDTGLKKGDGEIYN